ncbi:MAG: flagellar biosynthesis anti-sigma factor FlgM [Ktedonobacteraceae bacterium]
MSVESVTTVETRPGVQTTREFQTKPCSDAQAGMEAAVALGVQAVKKQPKVRVTRVQEARARLAARTYRQDSRAIAQKMLEME